MSKEIDQHILQFYQPKKLLGSGAYGHVWRVIEKYTKKVFALKKIFDAFQNSTDAQRTYRQISLLHQMDHKNIIKLQKVIKAQNKKDLYLVFEYMETDLHSLVGQSILSSNHLRFIVFQILKALKYLHSAQLIHRDLKPSNVLINSDCESTNKVYKVKLCDFGLARSLAHEQHQENILSEDVATRWYRSPEMLLSSRQYGKPTDIWSVGCIIAQLLYSQPIFQGSSTLNQLQKIMEFTGMPSQHSIDSLKSDVAQNIINTLTVRKKSVKDYFVDCDLALVQITIKMLDFNPNKRSTAEQLLAHHIFKQFQKHEQQEQICSKFIVPSIDDNVKLKLQQYRKIIYKDIERRYPQFSDARIKGLYSVIQKSIVNIQKPRNNSVNLKDGSLLNSTLKKSKNKSLKKCKSQSKVKKVQKQFNKNSSNTNLTYLKQKFAKHSPKKHQVKPVLEEAKPVQKQKAKDLVKHKIKKQNIQMQCKAQVYEKQLKKTKSKNNLLCRTKSKKVLFVNKNRTNINNL